MLRAANSLRLVRGRAEWMMNTNANTCIPQKMQQRNYIFLPASFQELSQMISEAWTSQKAKRRTVWVKLWQRPNHHHDPNNATTDSTTPSSAVSRKRRSLSSKTRTFRMRQHKSYIASKRKFQNAKRLFREQATVRMNRLSKRLLWEYKPLPITEPCNPDWFDADGYPKAVRNAFGRFVNPWKSQSTNGMQSLWKFFHWRVERLYNMFVNPTASLAPSPTCTTDTLPTLAFQSTPPPEHQIRCTWLGHSTTLVELEGFVVLTDPIFSPRASPIASWGGASRLMPAPCTVNDLPSIDVCVVSHDHYDHLDLPSVLQLKNKVEYWAVPLGMGEWLQDSCDIPSSQILEMTWWQSASLERMSNGTLRQVDSSSANNNNGENVLELTCAPAQHWCGRNMLDRNQRLWCSWVVGAGSLKYFFAGDTALPETFPLHRQIGDRLGPFDVAALPIGAYAPSYFMKVSHVDPSEAVKIHQDLRVTKSMAIHWGTFHLSEEAYEDPPRLLQEATEDAGVDFVAVSQGECVVGPEVQDQEGTVPMTAVEDAKEDSSDSDDERVEYG